MQNNVTRRTFLKIMAYAGIFVGCRPGLSDTTTPQPSQVQTLPPVLPLSSERLFALQDDAVSYTQSPIGCNRTTLRGTVQSNNGTVSGLVVQVATENEPFIGQAITGSDGYFELDVADGAVDSTFLVQLINETRTEALSEVIIARSIPDCNLNIMVVNFVES